MNKSDLTISIVNWLPKFLKKNFPHCNGFEIIPEPGILSNLHKDYLKNIKGLNTWNFSPDIFIALVDKNSRENHVILIHRTVNSISLREIGELRVQCLIANPLLGLIISTRGCSNNVNLLMLDDDVRERCLSYNSQNPIGLVGWDIKNNVPDSDNIIPLKFKNFFKI